jgi:SM-20-related protein
LNKQDEFYTDNQDITYFKHIRKLHLAHIQLIILQEADRIDPRISLLLKAHFKTHRAWLKLNECNMEDEEIQERNQFEELIQGLIDHKYGCSNDFISPSTVTGLRDAIQSLSESGKMKLAGVGNAFDTKQDKEIRGDKINWIQETSINPFEIIYLKKVGKFIEHLNKTCFTSIKSFESHYSNYEKKSFYKRHLDQFKSEKGRKFSIIVYLNEDWQDEDGGMLSLYPEAGEQQNISPIGGRIVFFRSDEMEHEVHPSFTKERKSIAAWFKN